MVTQIIGGQLSDKHGGEIVLWVFGIGWSVTILSITLTANLSEMFVIVGNFVNGLCQGEYVTHREESIHVHVKYTQ